MSLLTQAARIQQRVLMSCPRVRKNQEGCNSTCKHNHRVNETETAVKAEKYHMIARLAMIDPDYSSCEDWKQKMRQNHVYCDETFQQLAADYFRRDLVLVCAYQEDGYDQMGRIVKKCNFETTGPPFHLLYYNETRFAAGHFQSIVISNTIIRNSRLTHWIS